MSTIPLSPTDLATAATLLIVVGLVSVALQLGLGKRLLLAAVRTVVQLTLVGMVLEWVFARERWWLVSALFASMLLNAGLSAVQRTERRFRGIWLTGILSVSVSGIVATFVVTEAVIGVDPWYAPRYTIPLLGMVLGNALTGISLCLDRAMSDLKGRRGEVEGMLVLGATIWEATRPVVAGAVRAGMIPILNSMSVVGIVSLPGMMTGQILAGARPIDAVKYQIVVMFMIAGATAIGTVLAGVLAFHHLTTAKHQLRPLP
ncbi:MAG: iron export ABC transporter permease subunit FetB [Myxococcales bacterium]|nr:iron export ABC transporter permease subunit FetB [Myxococcales bacterium]MDD9964667.1 iron export ABC transporter permease subunit FetB [Myxococcales bacterium]